MSQSLSNDTLPGSIPKLDHRGKNWAIFKIRFQNAMEAKDKWGHFDGLMPRPEQTLPFTQADVTENESVVDEVDLAAKWDKDKRTAKYMLTQRLPDSTLV